MRIVAAPKHMITTASWCGTQFVEMLIAACAAPGSAQGATRSGAHFDALARIDKALFDAAFVNFDTSKLRTLFTEDAQSHHYRTGLAAGEVARTMGSFPRSGGSRAKLGVSPEF